MCNQRWDESQISRYDCRTDSLKVLFMELSVTFYVTIHTEEYIIYTYIYIHVFGKHILCIFTLQPSLSRQISYKK